MTPLHRTERRDAVHLLGPVIPAEDKSPRRNAQTKRATKPKAQSSGPPGSPAAVVKVQKVLENGGHRSPSTRPSMRPGARPTMPSRLGRGVIRGGAR